LSTCKGARRRPDKEENDVRGEEIEEQGGGVGSENEGKTRLHRKTKVTRKGGLTDPSTCKKVGLGDRPRLGWKFAVGGGQRHRGSGSRLTEQRRKGGGEGGKPNAGCGGGKG